MKFSDLIFKKTKEDGIQAIHKIGVIQDIYGINEYTVSIIRNRTTYGFEYGLYEVAILKDGLLYYDSKYSDVVGFLDESEVIMEIHNITEHLMRKKPSQVTFINLTPHELNIYNSSSELLLKLPKPPNGEADSARVETEETHYCYSNSVELFKQKTGKVYNLPEEQKGVCLIVSAMVRCALPERKDLASPGKLLRNKQGQPIGCQGLIIN